VIVVVRDRGQRRGVGGQRDGCQRRTFHLETVEQFGGEVLCIGGRAAVAAGHDLAVAEQAAGHCFHGGGDRGGELRQRLLLDGGAVFELAGNTLDEVHFGRAKTPCAGGVRSLACVLQCEMV